MGKPSPLGLSERMPTQGNEKSKYLEEYKSTEIPPVVRAKREEPKPIDRKIFGGCRACNKVDPSR